MAPQAPTMPSQGGAGAGAGGIDPALAGLFPTKFDNTLGALLLGGLAATALWGVTCVQTFSYFHRHSSRDKGVFKSLMAFLWVLDTFDTVLNIHILYFYLVSNYANPLAIAFPVWSVLIHVAITSISNFIIRSMFARRAYRLSNGNIPMTLVVLAVSTTDLVVGIVITVKAFGLASYAELDRLSSLLYLNFAAGTTSDLLVATILCYLLRRSRTGFNRTDTLINVLMTYSINTGLIVAVDASLGMIFYIVMPNNFIFLGFYLLLSKLYLNSYLATLNARESLRAKTVEDPRSINLSDMPRFTSYNFSTSQHYHSEPTAVEKSADSTSAMGISVQTVVKRQMDEESVNSLRSGGHGHGPGNPQVGAAF